MFRYGFLDGQVVFSSGDISDQVYNVSCHRISVLRLASGIGSSSCMAVLPNLYPRLSKGGYIVIDDYASAIGCKAAVDSFRGMMSILSINNY